MLDGKVDHVRATPRCFFSELNFSLGQPPEGMRALWRTIHFCIATKLWARTDEKIVLRVAPRSRGIVAL